MVNSSQERLIQDLFLLQRIAQKISGTLDLDTLLMEIVNDVSVSIGCSRLAVLLKDDATNELVIGADCGGDSGVYLKGRRLPIGAYGIVGRVGATGERYYAPDVKADPYYVEGDSKTRSEVDIPLHARGRLIGVLNAQHADLDGFPPERIQILEALAGHVATAIENARLFQRERAEKERMAKELDEARAIQQGLFPARPPSVPGFTIEGTCLPCGEVGGDWYDFLPLPDGKIGIVLADVSGKGLGAAMLMSSTRTVLRLVAETGVRPGVVLARVNHMLLRDFPPAKFVTMIYAVLDPARGTLAFANAGHCYPLVADEERVHAIPTDTGLPLGIQETDFAEQSLSLSSRSRVLFYSDGIPETMNRAGELFGEHRLRDQMAQPGFTIARLWTAMERFREFTPAADDVTAVLLSPGVLSHHEEA